jgi:Peptidase family M23
MLVRRLLLITLSVLFASRVLAALPASAQTVRDIAFPAEGPVTFYDDFGMSRSGGRTHEGNDLLGAKMRKLFSAVDGYVTYLVYPEADWGYAVVIRDDEGYTYHYLHVNNDTPGTDDGNGGPENAYAPGIYDGARVTRGQHIAWMGDSGNAESVGPHLHFEIRYNGTPIDPYPSLIAAQQEGGFDPAAATAASPDFNADRNIQTGVNPGCVSGSRVKSSASKAVYYCGGDGKRYVFPNDKTYYTWFANFSGVTTLTDAQLAALPLGGNVTYRPGVKMVKIQSDPKVYAVDRGGTLRWVQTPEIAAAMYGADWAKKVEDVSDAFFINYKVGEPITRAL